MRAAASTQLAKPGFTAAGASLTIFFIHSIFETLLFSAGLAIPRVSVAMPQSPHGVPTVLQFDTG